MSGPGTGWNSGRASRTMGYAVPAAMGAKVAAGRVGVGDRR